jgi:hypothetical protein
MKNLTAQLIGEMQSQRRGIKEGWYAMSVSGAVCSGPFSSRVDCESHIECERVDIDTYHQGADNSH